MKIKISGYPLPEPLTIQLTEEEQVSLALSRDHAMQILQAWQDAPTGPEDGTGPSDVIRLLIPVGQDGPGEEVLTVLHMDAELTVDRWAGSRGYCIRDWPFDFEWELIAEPIAEPTRLPIEKRVPSWDVLNPGAREAIMFHDAVLQPDAWFKGVHDGRTLEYLAACNSGADGDDDHATMVSILLDFTGGGAPDATTRELRNNVWSTGYDA